MASPNSTFTAGQILTAAQTNNFPFGWVAEQTLATNYAASSGTTDVTGLSVTFTAVASRKYLIVAMFNLANSTNNVSQIFINNGATALAEGYYGPIGNNNVGTATIFTIQTPGAGSVTYKTQMAVAAGTTTVYGTSTRASLASRMFVLDIGIA